MEGKQFWLILDYINIFLQPEKLTLVWKETQSNTKYP